jgi:ribosome-binding factor A
LIKIELGKLIFKEFDFPKENLITITRVITTPDLKESKVFISVIPEKEEKDVLDILNSKIYFLQKKMDKKLKMKKIPKILFLKEEKTKAAAKIEEILEKLKNQKE